MKVIIPKYFLSINRILILVMSIFFSLPIMSNIINRGGVLEQNEIWTSNDTVIVYSDLIIPENVTLLVEAGALVKVAINRGITVIDGSLIVVGNTSDSVCFVPNHATPGLTWKWKGITIKNANLINNSTISYAHIIHAETGLKLENSQNVTVNNSSFRYCQNIGIQIINSSFCNIYSSVIQNNYDGVELYVSNSKTTSNNIIDNCIIRNENTNLYINSEFGGFYKNNTISRNLIDAGNNGVWIDNNGGSVNSINIIEYNLIINNGSGFGYGLFLNQDSTVIKNNLFWNNNIALLTDAYADNCQISNNNFYQNKSGISIGANSTGNKYLNNTFSLNKNEILIIKETTNNTFGFNNMFHNFGNKDIVVNSTTSNMDVVNNYWGTADTAIIKSLIYDKHDNPIIGTLPYAPFLLVADTTNPMSAPNNVIKQIVNNRLKVTWDANSEADLSSYNIYYNNFVDYSFNQKMKLELDTTYVFSNEVSIYDTIAVTALDPSIAPRNSNFYGNESPFAFAAIYPYAGADTIICKHITELEINNVTVPMAYDNLVWISSGDGYFNNTDIINPIYFPGSADINMGGALLSLKVINNNDTLIDSFFLTIINDPVAYAGADTIVAADVDLFLDKAYAENYDNVLWTTSGDGFFNSNTIVNPIYYLGVNDVKKGNVNLVLNSYSQCGYSSDTMTVIVEPYFSVEGKVSNYQKSTNPSVVIAYKKNVQGSRAVQSESVQSDGSFLFEKLIIGDYYIYAVPDTNNTNSSVPSYYANKLSWIDAYVLPVYANVYDIDIFLPLVDYILPVGEASISGHMDLPKDLLYNQDIYCTPWFQTNSDMFCNNGLSNVTVFLYNKTQHTLLDYTLTNQLGNFYFNNLPYGGYIVDVEKAGYHTTPSLVITLSPQHKAETDVVISINQQKIAVYTDAEIHNDNYVTVFPNPAFAEINILIDKPQLTQIKIYNVFGNCIISTSVNINSLNYKLNIESLNPGLYFGVITNSINSSQFRFVKR